MAVPGVLAHGNDLRDLIPHRLGGNLCGLRVVAELHGAAVIDPGDRLGVAVELDLDLIGQPELLLDDVGGHEEGVLLEEGLQALGVATAPDVLLELEGAADLIQDFPLLLAGSLPVPACQGLRVGGEDPPGVLEAPGVAVAALIGEPLLLVLADAADDVLVEVLHDVEAVEDNLQVRVVPLELVAEAGVHIAGHGLDLEHPVPAHELQEAGDHIHGLALGDEEDVLGVGVHDDGGELVAVMELELIDGQGLGLLLGSAELPVDGVEAGKPLLVYLPDGVDAQPGDVSHLRQGEVPCQEPAHVVVQLLGYPVAGRLEAYPGLHHLVAAGAPVPGHRHTHIGAVHPHRAGYHGVQLGVKPLHDEL